MDLLLSEARHGSEEGKALRDDELIENALRGDGPAPAAAPPPAPSPPLEAKQEPDAALEQPSPNVGEPMKGPEEAVDADSPSPSPESKDDETIEIHIQIPEIPEETAPDKSADADKSPEVKTPELEPTSASDG